MLIAHDHSEDRGAVQRLRDEPRVAPVRTALGLLDVSDFLSMRPAPAQF
jgi:hypothetical protein